MSFIYSKMRSALPSSLGGAQATNTSNPPSPAHPVVLMRNHGFATVADGLERAVYQAVYTREAALLQTAAMGNQAAWGVVGDGLAVEGSVDVEGKGKIKGGKVGGDGGGRLAFLKDKEVADCWDAMGRYVPRAWRLWCREVEVAPLYQNKVSAEE